MPKVLIVDDSRLMRRMLHACIATRMDDLDFLEATDGLDALTKLEAIEFDVDAIFCDLRMPNMNGLDFLDALADREKLDSCPVVVVTSDVHTGGREALKRGAKWLISKPFASAMVLKALQDVLSPAR